jgi:hypothetical protein
MKRTIAILAILAVWGVMFYGCATGQLPKDPTPEQVRAARCQDAVTGVAISNVWLTTKQMTVEESKYWVAYQESAKLLVAQYCMGVAP